MKKYDAIVIGSGQAGTPLSKKIAKQGLHTALIERRFIGGTCVNDGCTPTKTMVASARTAYMAKRSSFFGVNTGDVSVDIQKIVARKNDIVDKFRSGSQKGLEKTEHLEVICGEATFTGIKQIEVSTSGGEKLQLTADLIFIDTGVSPVIPDIKGIDQAPYLTSTSILDVSEVPDHLLIVGGSYIALEFGQMLKRFGSEVTIIEKNEKFLSREDRDVAECMKSILSAEGLKIHCNATISAVQSTSSGILATAKIGNQSSEIKCSHLLLAAGRKPKTSVLQLHHTGVEVNDKGYINVDDKLQTSQPGIYALGDVKGGPAFTHISYNDYHVVYKNLFEKADLSIANRMVPYCMFTDPQLGHIGMNEEEARKKNLRFKTATLSMESVARAIETGETRGMMKAIVDMDTKLVLGATIIGEQEQGGEIMSVLQMAIMGKVPYTDIRDGVFAHPLYAESLNNLFMSIED